MFSQAEENYLKSIYALEKELLCSISTNLIAQKTETKASSVTDMLKKLDSKKLVVYQKYQGVSLTEKGKKIALKVIRKHRLWEFFLVEKLHYSWDKVHDIAEQLEHIQSETLIDKLDAFLEFPKFDPHGDPIPNVKGEISKDNQSLCLSNCKEGKTYSITRLKSDDKEFFDFCTLYGLKLGNQVMVTNQFNFNNMTQISINSNTLLLNADFTNIIYVKEINEKPKDSPLSSYKLF